MPGGRGKGGKRTPAQPAAVAGPGALSRRTDGGPADPQGIRLAPAENYGDRQAMAQLQGAAPMRGGGVPASPVGVGGPSPTTGSATGAGPRPVSPVDVFAPGDESEPITAGIPFGPGPAGRQKFLTTDPDEALHALYDATGAPGVLAIIQRRQRMAAPQ